MPTFAKNHLNQWFEVESFNSKQCQFSPQALSFSQLWSGSPLVKDNHKQTLSGKWETFDVPLPDTTIPCLAFGLTYPGHQKEVGQNQSLYFEKKVNATKETSMDWRPYLDFEAEIGILMHRDQPDKLGFLMVNDLTDRYIQTMTFDPKDPRPGFSASKSFPGALQTGPLLFVGSDSDWDQLTITLKVNGHTYQQLRSRDCLLRPIEIHQKVFKSHPHHDWILIATGTPEGTLFKLPSLPRKFALFLKNGFSINGAKEEWLNHLSFLQPGDRLEMSSPFLGHSQLTLNNNPH